MRCARSRGRPRQKKSQTSSSVSRRRTEGDVDLNRSVDVPVALLGYGTVGAAVHRLLEESADDIERATGHRLHVVRALVRDVSRERAHASVPGVLTDDFGEIRRDPEIALVAEVMGGLEPAG